MLTVLVSPQIIAAVYEGSLERKGVIWLRSQLAGIWQKRDVEQIIGDRQRRINIYLPQEGSALYMPHATLMAGQQRPVGGMYPDNNRPSPETPTCAVKAGIRIGNSVNLIVGFKPREASMEREESGVFLFSNQAYGRSASTQQLVI